MSSYAGKSVEELPIPKPPYIKGKGFCCNPIVVNGIPDYADSLKNPKVIGTPEYESWWTEQLYRCINGYNTGGIFIPGRFYYYMNFNSMATVNGIINPDFCDLHLQLAYVIDFCRDNNVNLVMPKKRRAGISEAFQKMEVDYGYRFIPAYHAGVVAGKKTFADDFVKKWKISESLLIPELKINSLSRNDDEIVSGYIVNENGKNVEKGIKTEIYIRTAHSDPNVFKGTYLNAVICEEAGEFENFKEFYSATKDCLTDSGVQVGVMYIFGTGGNINKGSKDFKHVCEKLKDFNAILFVVTGDRFKKPYYGGATTKGKLVGITPSLSKIYKPYQLIGCEDREVSLNEILKERDELKKGELKLYLEHLQNNPISLEEIFRKMFSNKFDIQKINQQSDEIAKLVSPKYSKYKLEWILDSKGVRTGKVLPVLLKKGEDDSETVNILDSHHPNHSYQNLYCAGCLTLGEKVITDSGIKNVEDVTLDDKLINAEGDLVEIKNLQTRYKHNENVFTLKMSNTYRTTTFTKEHPIYISKPILNSDKTVNEHKLKFNFINAEYLEKDDWIKCPNTYYGKTNDDILMYWDDFDTRIDRRINNPINNKDFWWLVGLWLGDGWCQGKSKISFAFNINESYYINKVERIVTNLFGKKINSFKQRGNGCEYSVSFGQLNKFLNKNFGKYASGKKISEWVKYINDDFKLELISGYLSADGCISKEVKRGYYSTDFVSINLELLESIQDILFSLGIVSNLGKLRDAKIVKFNNRESYSDCKICYKLILSHHFTIQLVNMLDRDDIKVKKIDFSNLPVLRKRPKDGCFISEDSKYIYFKIRKIEVNKYSGYVYNFECDTHTFMCRHITTHNCDPYDQDEAKSSKSLGGMCVMIRRNSTEGLQMAPIATICTRPKRKEIFFDMCLKLAVYYNLNGSVLGDKAGSSGIITWFKDNGFQRLLALRPTKFESENSEQSHEYWVSLNKTSKPMMIGLMQTNIYDRVQDNWFPDLIDQLGNYDEVEIGSDNDLADAYGIALMQDVSTNVAPRDNSLREKENPFSLGGWEYNKQGVLVPVKDITNRPTNPEQDFDGFGK